jgi:hypothetical protein
VVSGLLVTNVPLVREMVTKLVEGRAVSFSLYRRIVMIRLFCCLVLLAAFVLPAAADTPIIIDGQFDRPGARLVEITPSSSTQIPLWTVTSGSVDWRSAYWGHPPDGGYSVDLNGDGPGGITSTVVLDPGQYLLSFWLAGDPASGLSDMSVNVSAGSARRGFDVTPQAEPDLSLGSRVRLDWTLETLAFSVYGSGHIAFHSGQTIGAYGPIVGNVSLTKTADVPVPEAGFYSAFALNLAGLLLLARRRRSDFRSQYCSSGKWRKLRRMKQLCGMAS